MVKTLQSIANVERGLGVLTGNETVGLVDESVSCNVCVCVRAPAGLIGVNLWPREQNRRYLLCPHSMFCEFLPESSMDKKTPPTLLMEEVKEGRNYELVITNASGLFRSE